MAAKEHRSDEQSWARDLARKLNLFTTERRGYRRLEGSAPVARWNGLHLSKCFVGRAYQSRKATLALPRQHKSEGPGEMHAEEDVLEGRCVRSELAYFVYRAGHADASVLIHRRQYIPFNAVTINPLSVCAREFHPFLALRRLVIDRQTEIEVIHSRLSH